MVKPNSAEEAKRAFDEALARAEPKLREVMKKFGPLPRIPGAVHAPGSPIADDIAEALFLGQVYGQHRKLSNIIAVVEGPETPLARNLRRLRTEAGWSQDQLVDAIAMLPEWKPGERKTGKSTIQHHEGNKGYTKRALKRYADAFTIGCKREVTVEELLK